MNVHLWIQEGKRGPLARVECDEAQAAEQISRLGFKHPRIIHGARSSSLDSGLDSRTARWRRADGFYRPAPTLLWVIDTVASIHPTPPELQSISGGLNKRVVYFVSDGRGAVKIGSTGDIHARLKAMAIASRDELTLLGTIDGGHDAEKELHRRFAAQHIRGEWFRIEGVLAHYLESLR